MLNFKLAHCNNALYWCVGGELTMVPISLKVLKGMLDGKRLEYPRDGGNHFFLFSYISLLE